MKPKSMERKVAREVEKLGPIRVAQQVHNDSISKITIQKQPEKKTKFY